MRAELRDVVAGFVQGLDLSISPDVDEEALDPLADFVTHARTAVMRDGYSRDILTRPQLELPTRLVKQLAALFEALVLMGVPADRAHALTRKAAYDSMPPERLATLRVLRPPGTA